MMNLKSISVFIPALNERENIEQCIISIKKYLNKRFKDYEIIVVTNGSTDETEKIVESFSKKDKHIKNINDKKSGYGAALKAGFRHSSKDLIFYTDSDNQFNISELDSLLPLLQKNDIVSAYRINRKDSKMRIFIADVYNLIIKLLFNLKVKDIDCAFKLYKKDVFKEMKLKSNTGLIDAEILIKAIKNGFLVGQIGVTHYPRTKGQTSYVVGKQNNGITIVKPKVIIDILKEIKNLWSELR